MIRPTVLALCALAPTFSAAQLSSVQPELGQSFLDSLGLLHADVQALQLPDEAGAPFELSLELEGSERLLSLAPHSLRADGFRLFEQDASEAIHSLQAPPSSTYRGTLSDAPDGVVAASLVSGQLSAQLRLEAGAPLWFVQPLSDVLPGADSALHVVYSAADLLDTGATCAAESIAGGLAGSAGLPSLQGSALRVCQIAVEADFEFYQLNGSSTTVTLSDIEDVLNGVGLIYQADPNILYELTAAFVQTSTNDPYTSSSAGMLLNQFRSHWNSNHQSVQRDIAHLFTGRDLDGSVIGVAKFSVICSNSNDYGLSQSRFSPSMGNRVALTAHELGHNWAAAHCDGDDDCELMCSGLGGCGGIYKFGSSALSQIVNKKNNANCLSSPSAPVLSASSRPRSLRSTRSWSP